ncbi:3-isopropylmalate dehydratase small subunit [Serratia fonticola]|uniref:3-isopropylmalate dehydratase small subunit n=1 Tax=Serratia fonticola TaxID=47917 RepID=A0A542BJB6_SERFO|nr:3-isopropylmalate dehydratase small subunit [Serratia fonticola]TQI78665.1 3-isopropylmalate dehydratase small subunit [Serratia fonticola]TQI99313.1 3-isopropylmalate dehydratase small subunit [Serratia fonticola]TVZ68838.1 3-isopropylmalate dehydratase small subunit [Serratia fonticola]
MEPFNLVSGVVAPMMVANIDTDVIMPKQFLKGIDRQGLNKGVFYDLRFLADGQPNAAFVLNQPGWKNAAFLLVGPNFGCGSSREHAVWGLKQLGIRALIGSSFAGIFNDNCQRNGVLTIELDESSLRQLETIATDPQRNTLTINLEQQWISSGDSEFVFSINSLKRKMLLEGLDAIDYTLQYQDDIRSFETQHFAKQPWLTC